MKNLFLNFMLFLSITSFASSSLILPSDPNIHYLGRINKDNPNHYLYAHAGISIKIKFKGTGVKAVIHDYTSGTATSTNYYKVIVDNSIVVAQLKILPGENTYDLISDISNEEHVLELIKITEAFPGNSSFKGFYLIGDAAELLPFENLKTRKIEFIGDSWTAAFGNVSQYSTGPASMANSNYVAANQDVYYSWVSIAARALQADYHVTASSGKGMYRNNTGALIETVPLMYDNTLEKDASQKYNHVQFHPDVISIHLGTNDMALEESGVNFKMDDQKFEETYVAFVQKLLNLHPCATVLICFGNSKSDFWPTWTKQLSRLRTIAQNVQKSFPEGRVHLLELPITAEKYTGNKADDCGYGDAWHPSKCSHEEMANKLIAKVNAMNIEWGKTACEPLNSAQIILPNLHVYPNPANQVLFVDYLNDMPYQIYDLSGKLVQNGWVNQNQISVDNLVSGLYVLILQNNQQIQSTRFIKN
jgi:hypothetical protein